MSEQNKYPIGGYAPGNYYGTCCICGQSFQGDKRAVICEPCAIKSKEEFEKNKEEFEALSPSQQQELIERNVAAAKEFFRHWR